MKKNKIHCLIINQSAVLTAELSRVMSYNQKQCFVEVIDRSSQLLKAKVTTHQIGLLFIAKTRNESSIDSVFNLLRQYSPDTILVFLTAKNQPIQHNMLGVEYCDLSLNTVSASPLILSNLLSYVHVKRDLRSCKHLLSIVDQRNRWLVDITHEPIAYIYQGVHVHANPAYLALFGFQSMAELMGTMLNDLIPVENQAVFGRFVNKQKKHLSTRQSLLLTMQRLDKQVFRSDIRIAPAVINHTKCLQIGVHKLKSSGQGGRFNVNGRKARTVQADIRMNIRKKHFRTLKPPLPKKTPLTASVTTAATATNSMKINKAKQGEVGMLKDKLSLKQLIAYAQKKQLNKLDIQPLKDTNSGAITHYFVDMLLKQHRVDPVKSQLKKSYGMSTDMFRDYVTITALISQLRKKGRVGERYIVELDVANLRDKRFSRWLSIQLQQLPKDSSQIVFLLPYIYCKKNVDQLAGFLFSLKNTEGYIGLNNFTPSMIGMNIIKRFQVKYIAFAAEWLEQIRGNKQQRKVLSTLTQKLGRSGIEVIVSPSKAA